MSDDALEIFKIPDFEKDSVDSSEFYYAELKRHLYNHKFIQKPHKHDFYIILLFTSGSGIHTIDFKTYEVNPGSAFFLSPGQVHSWELSSDANGHILFFSSDFYCSVFTRKRLNLFIFFHSSFNSRYLRISAEEMTEVLFIFERVRREVENPNWSGMELLKNYTDLLLINFYRFYSSKTAFLEEKIQSYDQFQNLEDLIEESFKKHREASFYAELMNLSLKQLNALSKKTVAKTISQLIMERVILESQRLLIHSDLSISEIAYEIQFEDPSYFSRLFKKKTGMTPDQFRKQIKNTLR